MLIFVNIEDYFCEFDSFNCSEAEKKWNKNLRKNQILDIVFKLEGKEKIDPNISM